MSDDESRLISTMLKVLREGPARIPSLQDIEHSDAVLILGEDVTNVAPRMALSLRQSARQQPLQLAENCIFRSFSTIRCESFSTTRKVRCSLPLRQRPAWTMWPPRHIALRQKIYARLGFAVAHALDARAPVPDLSGEAHTLAERIAHALRDAQYPLVVSGPSCGSEAVIQAAANVARALCTAGRPAGLSFIMPECDSFGLGLIGGKTLSAAFQVVEAGGCIRSSFWRMICTGERPRRRWIRFLNSARHVVVLDYFANRTTAKAELVLPTGTFAETDGTLVNNEGRAQRSFAVFPPAENIQESWRWLRDMMVIAGRGKENPWQKLRRLSTAMATTLPALAHALEAAPSAAFRMAGAKIPRAPHR